MSKAYAILTLAKDYFEAYELCKQYAYDWLNDWENGVFVWRFDDNSALVFDDDASYWISK